MDIDFVIPWVDGYDEKWLEKRNHYLDESSAGVDAGDNRYRDWGFMKFWFRSVEKFAPWVHHIYLITDGQMPEWMNTDAEKLTVVDHKDFIPEKFLPVFSCNPIELNMHRIKGLSEHFVYFNDDTLITAPVKETDFFRGGLPCGLAVESPITPDREGVFNHILVNNCVMLNSHFSRREFLRSQFTKRFSLVDAKGFILNAGMSVLKRDAFFGFEYSHLPTNFLKSTFEQVWSENEERLTEVCGHKFRSADDVNQYVFSNYQYVTGKFAPYSWRKAGRVYHIDSTVPGNLEDICSAITAGKHKMLCINDQVVDDFEGTKKTILDAFGKVLPEKSSFEL